MKEFLSKKFGGLPVWAWALIGAAGIGAGYLLIRYQQKKTPSALTPANSADLTTGNASGNETNSATGTVGSNGVIDNPFPESNVNGQSVPIVPPGYQAVYDPNGNIVGWSPVASNPTPAPPPTTVPNEPAPGRVPMVPIAQRPMLADSPDVQPQEQIQTLTPLKRRMVA